MGHHFFKSSFLEGAGMKFLDSRRQLIVRNDGGGRRRLGGRLLGSFPHGLERKWEDWERMGGLRSQSAKNPRAVSER